MGIAGTVEGTEGSPARQYLTTLDAFAADFDHSFGLMLIESAIERAASRTLMRVQDQITHAKRCHAQGMRQMRERAQRQLSKGVDNAIFT